MKVEEFMTTKIEFIDASATVYDAIEKMVDKHIRSLLARFPGNEIDSGVITARDITFKVMAKGLDPNDLKVAKIVSRPIQCIEKDMDIFKASAMMESHNVARIFVCHDDKIVGVVSLVDILDAALIMRARGEYVPR